VPSDALGGLSGVRIWSMCLRHGRHHNFFLRVSPIMDDAPLLHHQQIKARTPIRAGRGHRGTGHWHVRVRTNVIVCRACGASIPKWHNPQSCPECGAGRDAAKGDRGRHLQTRPLSVGDRPFRLTRLRSNVRAHGSEEDGADKSAAKASTKAQPKRRMERAQAGSAEGGKQQ
jgi:hypothetical protein